MTTEEFNSLFFFFFTHLLFKCKGSFDKPKEFERKREKTEIEIGCAGQEETQVSLYYFK